MTWKQIEAGREIRLWVGQVIVPSIALGIMLSPIIKMTFADKGKNIKSSIKKRFNKDERS